MKDVVMLVLFKLRHGFCTLLDVNSISSTVEIAFCCPLDILIIMSNNIVLITGLTVQDVSCLSEPPLAKGCEVHVFSFL